MKIWANTIVRNEENFIWFALMSVIKYVDRILVYDTGSTDDTVSIIGEARKLYKDKICFKEVGEVDKFRFTKIRQDMLNQSKCDWILLLDGDEIWWEDSIRKIAEEIENQGTKIDGIVVPVVVPVGDIYHLQEEEAGRYNLLGRKGHYNLRAINRHIPGLYVDMPYGRESFFDENRNPIEERRDIIFMNTPYLHVTHLKRSKLRRRFEKYKHELGSRPRLEFKYPEVLFRQHPDVVLTPWVKISGIDKIKARFFTPLRKIKRRVLLHYCLLFKP